MINEGGRGFILCDFDKEIDEEKIPIKDGFLFVASGVFLIDFDEFSKNLRKRMEFVQQM